MTLALDSHADKVLPHLSEPHKTINATLFDQASTRDLSTLVASATLLSPLRMVYVRFAVHQNVVLSFPALEPFTDSDADHLDPVEKGLVIYEMLQWMYGHDWTGSVENSSVKAALGQFVEFGTAVEKVSLDRPRNADQG